MKQKFYWNEEKIDELKSLWNTKPLYKIASYFHVAEDNIIEKAEELGLEEYKSNRWTKEEEQLLYEYSKKYVTKTIAKKLGRSYLSVQKKAVKLGIELHSTPDPWKKWMIDYLKDNINKRPIGEICNMIGLSYHLILTKCKELGIEYIKEGWTEEEINILKEYANKCHYTELTKVLPNRSVGAIAAKAHELNIKTISMNPKLSDEQIKYIKDNWGVLPATEIARNLKISAGTLNRYKKELNLPNTGQKKKWTDDIIEKLREYAKTKTRKELAKKFKTSPGQISVIAKRHNIKLIDSKIVWTDELNSKLERLIEEGLGLNEISKELNMKPYSVREQIRKINNNFVNTSSKVIRWSEKETNELIRLSKNYTSIEIAKMLNKTEKQVSTKAKKIGININRDVGKKWTEEDTKTLTNLFNSHEIHDVAKIMGRSEDTVRKKTKELGLALKYKKRTKWSIEEEQLLKEYSEIYTINEIANILGRTTASVNGKLKYLGIKVQTNSRFWTEQEENELKVLSRDFSIEEISKKMNRSYDSVFTKLYHLGIKAKSHSNRRWTSVEEQKLLELLATHSTSEVAKVLDRSEEAIIVKAHTLGYNTKRKNWTSDEDMLLSDLWGTEPIENISRKLNRTASSIINRVYILKLGSQIDNNYDGITIQDIANIFKVDRNIILTSWVSLGLKLSIRKRGDYSKYYYVQISDLYEFLEKNQNIWDSRNLEKNIFGNEPKWLEEKRIKDRLLPEGSFKIENLTKQQLLLAKQYYLDLNKNESTIGPKLVKKHNNKKGD